MSLFQFVDKAAMTLDRFCYSALSAMGGTTDSYCKPIGLTEKNADGHQYIYCSDHSVVSFLEVEGIYRAQTPEEEAKSLDILCQALRSYMNTRGHILQMCMHYNQTGGRKLVEREMDAMAATGLKQKMDIGHICNSWTDEISKHVKEERVIIALWTLSSEVTDFANVHKQWVKKNPDVRPPESGTMHQCVLEMNSVHEKFVVAVRAGFNQANIAIRELTCEQSLWYMRYFADESMTSEDWKPTFDDSMAFATVPLPGSTEVIQMPKLAKQIFPRDVEIEGRRFVRIGNRLHAPLYLNLAPHAVKSFNLFLEEIRKNNVNWRVLWSFRGNGDENGLLQMNHHLSRFLSWASGKNRMINNTMNNLLNLKSEGEVLLEMKGVFDVFIDGPDSPETRQTLERAVSVFVGVMQSWGTQEIRTVPEDPFYALCASIPGLLSDSPSIPCIAPLRDIVDMWPLSRPYSPWNHGGVLRTVDGKIFCYRQQSGKQASWATLGVAPMGGGKSVRLCTENLEYLLQPGLQDLPYLSIIDSGPSSLGLINTIKHSLPEDMQHMALYSKLKNDKEYAINIFDTPLGVRYPSPRKRSFIIEFLCLLATPLDARTPVDGVSALMVQLVRLAYENADTHSPKLYTPHLFPDLDKKLHYTNMSFDKQTTWYEIADALFAAGFIHEAEVAHRQAMPLIGDLIQICNDPQSMGSYRQMIDNENIVNYVGRKLRESLSIYPILSVTTRFDLGDARVVSLDLAEVASSEGDVGERQAGIFFLLANHVLTARFQEDAEDARKTPELYRAYHAKRISSVMKLPKKICIDEFHRIKKAGPVLSQTFLGIITTLIRESRKWRICVTLYSQSVKDYDPVLWELASAFYVHGVGTAASKAEIAEAFGLGDAGIDLMDKIGQPNSEGARFLAFYKADDKAIFNLLVSTLAKPLLWAYSSTMEDTVVRDSLYKTIGVKNTLLLLSKIHPNGIKDEAGRRAEEYAKKGIQSDVLDDITHEALTFYNKQALNSYNEDMKTSKKASIS